MNQTEQIILSLFKRLKPVQQTMFKAFYGSKNRKYLIHSSRRLGKTWLLCSLSIVFALSKSNAQIRYASVTQKAVRKMIHPIFKEIFKGVPQSKRGEWNSQNGCYKFSNGSEIHVAGVNNNHSDDLRGTATDLFIIDEAAFIDDLKYLVDSVAMPQLLTVKNSKLIMASSSPLSPAHEFVSYIQESRQLGNYSSYDIYSGGFDEEIIEEFKKEAGGDKSTTWRREYLNEIIVDAAYAVIPEFNKNIIEKYTPDIFDIYYHRYTSMDIGVRDNTAILFGVYDFKKATLYILAEVILSGNNVTTLNIAEAVKKNERREPYRRIADNNNLILLQDLQSLHNISFIPTNKDSLQAMTNELKLWIQNNRIKVDPKCTNLIGCLEFAIWNKDKSKWGKSQIYGHFDALASLMYLVRNIDQNTNPIPITHNTNFNSYIPPDDLETDTFNNIKKMFNIS